MDWGHNKKMRTILTPFLVLLAMARADQKDSRLPALFASLEGAADVAQAHSIEQQIWLIWIRHGNPKIDALMQVGSQLMVPGEYQRSLAAFNQIIAEAPDFAEGWNKRATVLYLLGDFEGSVRDIERTLALEIRHFGALAPTISWRAAAYQTVAQGIIGRKTVISWRKLSSVRASLPEQAPSCGLSLSPGRFAGGRGRWDE